MKDFDKLPDWDVNTLDKASYMCDYVTIVSGIASLFPEADISTSLQTLPRITWDIVKGVTIHLEHECELWEEEYDGKVYKGKPVVTLSVNSNHIDYWAFKEVVSNTKYFALKSIVADTPFMFHDWDVNDLLQKSWDEEQ